MLSCRCASAICHFFVCFLTVGASCCFTTVDQEFILYASCLCSGQYFAASVCVSLCFQISWVSLPHLLYFHISHDCPCGLKILVVDFFCSIPSGFVVCFRPSSLEWLCLNMLSLLHFVLVIKLRLCNGFSSGIIFTVVPTEKDMFFTFIQSRPVNRPSQRLCSLQCVMLWHSQDFLSRRVHQHTLQFVA